MLPWSFDHMSEKDFFKTIQCDRLTNEQLQERLGRRRLNELSLKRFGAVMISAAVYSGRLEVDTMFRQNPVKEFP